MAIKFLLFQVVEALCQHKSCDINATNLDGEPALYLAVTLKPECVRILLTSGASLNIRTNGMESVVSRGEGRKVWRSYCDIVRIHSSTIQMAAV